jgi:uncharacterized membrane protein
MTISRVIHKMFHWAGMLAAVAMVLIVPYFKQNPGDHGQNMGGAIGVALAPVVFWFLLAIFVIVAPIVAYVAARVADEPPEVRKRCWLPILIGVATSAIFWMMFVLGLN